MPNAIGNHSWDKETVEHVIELYLDKWGQQRISEMTGVSEAAVVRMLRGQHKHNKVRYMNGRRKGTLRGYTNEDPCDYYMNEQDES